MLFGKSAFQDAFFLWKSRDENERRREFTGERLSCDTDLLCLSVRTVPDPWRACSRCKKGQKYRRICDGKTDEFGPDAVVKEQFRD